jgi:putative DNA primase/helicase
MSDREDLLRAAYAAADIGYVDEPVGDVPDVDAEITRLALLSEIEYDRKRSAAAQSLGIRLPTLDNLVRRRRAHSDASGDDERQGTALQLDGPEPWPEAVKGEELVEAMTCAIQRHVVLNAGHALAATLWAIHTHALDYAEHSPRLHIASPEKRCGKTVLLRTLEPMVMKPLSTESITPAALFRVLVQARPTLLIDEVDTFLKDNEDMRALLNAGHGRNGAVIRSVGDDHEPRQFSVWGAVLLAGIGQIPSTIEDRSITIHLRRRLPSEETERLRTTRRDHLRDLGQKAARWVADNRDKLQDADPLVPEELDDRAQDNWRALIAIADLISAAVGARARAAARALAAEEASDDQSAAVLALADVETVFKSRDKDVISSQEVVAALNALEERPWGEWRRGEPLNPRGLSRLLKPFGIRSKQIKAFIGKGYTRKTVEAAATRYVDRNLLTEEEDPEVF